MPRLTRPVLVAAAAAVLCLLVGVAVVARYPRGTAGAAGEGPAVNRITVLDARPAAPALPAAARFHGLLDGVEMSEGEYQRRAADLPVAVMVDNWVDARPQYGLDRAEVVYEGLVEYGITRFMALYWRNDAEVIEPVRSARTQFLLPALEWGAVYAHVGAAADAGPADAARQMNAWGLRHTDEVEDVITRDPKRKAPHNAVASTAALRAYARAQGWTGPVTFTPWPFKAGGSAEGEQANAVEIDFDITGTHKGAFTVRWEYDATTNGYRRSQAGAPHSDGRSGEQLTAANVIVQIATLRTGVDRDGHVLYDLEGAGKAIILLDGKAVPATWQKDSRTGRTRYLDAAGRELPLNRGATWIELLPAGQPLTLSQG
jgi:hypothetical protein